MTQPAALGALRRWPPLSADAASAAGGRNMQLLIQLRWLAVAGQVLAIYAVEWVLEVRLPLLLMLAAPAALIGVNLLSMARVRFSANVSGIELFVALMADVAALTWLLYLSGGATNPFMSLFLLQVVLGAILLGPILTWALVAVTSLCALMLSVTYLPMLLPPGLLGHDFELYIKGGLVCFGLIAVLLVMFVTRISGNLRARDAYLAEMRQRAAEEDHIVRMGLLASGAAHELGTPLASLSVILSDWRRMPTINRDPELVEDLAGMQAEVERCKKIVTGILLSAGEARGEAPAVTTLHALVGDMVATWRSAQGIDLQYQQRLGEDRPAVSDTALQQVLVNVLDNAVEAGAKRIDVLAETAEEVLIITVTDDGSGFSPDILARFGQPYQSTKARHGAGLGLFLLVNVLRKLGGEASASNRPGGGAAVTLRLPLAALVLPDRIG